MKIEKHSACLAILFKTISVIFTNLLKGLMGPKPGANMLDPLIKSYRLTLEAWCELGFS